MGEISSQIEILQKADALDRELLAFPNEELILQGDGSDGLYQWYRNRFLPAGVGLAPYDRAIARFFLEKCGEFDRFIEIGAGIGQECILLALNQRRTWAIESTTVNFAMMRRAVERITDRLDSELPKFMTPVQDWYPNRAAEYVTSSSVLCFPTLSWGLKPGQEEMILDSLANAGGLILGLRTFFRLRESESEQNALIDQIRQRGFAAPIDVHVWSRTELTFPPDRIVFMRRSS